MAPRYATTANQRQPNKQIKHLVKVKSNGTLEFLGAPPPGLVVVQFKRRFSEIVPVNPVLRVVFRVLRFLFSEVGRVSDWTRRWSCLWEATILIGPARGTRRRARDREFLLHWEEQVWRNN